MQYSQFQRYIAAKAEANTINFIFIFMLWPFCARCYFFVCCFSPTVQVCIAFQVYFGSHLRSLLSIFYTVLSNEICQSNNIYRKQPFSTEISHSLAHIHFTFHFPPHFGNEKTHKKKMKKFYASTFQLQSYIDISLNDSITFEYRALLSSM